MKTRTKTIVWLLLMAATLHSCSKDKDKDDNAMPEPSVTELLTSGKWYLEAYSTVEGNIPPRTECEKHSYLEFFPNGNRMSENFHSDDEDNCVTDFIVTGTWELIDDTQIYYNDDGVETFIEIVSISETKLILSQELADLVYTLILDKNPGNG